MEMMQYIKTRVHLYPFILQKKKQSENVVSTAFILITHVQVYMILSSDISQMSMNKSLP